MCSWSGVELHCSSEELCGSRVLWAVIPFDFPFKKKASQKPKNLVRPSPPQTFSFDGQGTQLRARVELTRPNSIQRSRAHSVIERPFLGLDGRSSHIPMGKQRLGSQRKITIAIQLN